MSDDNPSWIEIFTMGGGIYRCKCSKCGVNPLSNVDGIGDYYLLYLPNYCSTCGAGMVNGGLDFNEKIGGD